MKADWFKYRKLVQEFPEKPDPFQREDFGPYEKGSAAEVWLRTYQKMMPQEKKKWSDFDQELETIDRERSNEERRKQKEVQDYVKEMEKR